MELGTLELKALSRNKTSLHYEGGEARCAEHDVI
jgi:hypothetical protein